jgi:hypothetical protein
MSFLSKMVSIAAIASLSAAYSQNSLNTQNKKTPVIAKQEENDICPPKKKKKKLLSAYNSSARIDVKSSWDVFVKGSYILWQVKEKGLELALSSLEEGFDTSHKVKNMDFSYKHGFKVGVCTNFDYDGWNAFIEYSRLHIKNNHKVHAPVGGYLLPIHTYFERAEESPTNNRTSFCKERWRLKYDMVDFEVGRPCYVGTKLTFKPRRGAKFGWLDQKLYVDYTFTHLEDPPIDIDAFSSLHSDSWLVGPRAGVYTNWFFCKWFRFFGNIAGSLTYQRFKTFFKQSNYEDPGHLDFNVRDKTAILTPIVDMRTGFGWGSYFACNNWHFDLSASYDFSYFWNQNTMRRLEDRVLRNVSTKASDLMFHGLTAAIRFDF